MTGQRTIHHGDAIKWLSDQKVLDGCSIITSLPDISEFPQMTLSQWQEWFVNTAALVLSRCPDNGITIFYQTDLKKDGVWIDKGFLCQKAAEKTGHDQIAHKIVCRAPAGITTFGRPGYSHMLCFSKKIRIEHSQSLMDVLPEAGEVTWTRGMGIKACQLACRMVKEYTDTKTIVDPFCGHGSVLAVANEMGMDAVGVELRLKNVKKAQCMGKSEAL